jgi:dihydroorotase-like cyclic amidohydrolase
MRFAAYFALSALVSVLSLPALAQNYDLVINNGRVMDPETMYDGVANVGIKDGRIATITKDTISGKEAIDASGLVVAPGFIDTHFHWTRPLGYKLALRDGVTTAMDLEAGVFGPRVGEWYDMHKGKAQVNYGTASGHEFARAAVMDGYERGLDAPASIVEGRAGKGWSDKVATLEEGNKMLSYIDEGLRQGALGVASTVGYMPGATAREMYEVQKVGANYGRPTSVHTRYTPGTVTTEVNGAQEILLNAIALGAPAVVNHYNNPGWQMTQELLVRLRERGFNVWGEYYPYAAGSTTINASFIRPENWIDKLGHKYEDTLQDPTTGKFFNREQYEKIVAENPTKQIVLYKMPPEEIPKWVAMPGVVMASDAMPVPGGWDQFAWDTPYEDLPNMHPRAAGSHGTSLRLAREHDIPLMQVLATFSYNPAKYLGAAGVKAMQERGRMQEGMVADITIFDPETVRDNATYEKGSLPTTGIPYVVVNGDIVVKDSKVLPDVFPGQPIRFPVEEKGRFEPLDEDTWKSRFMVAPVGFYGLDLKEHIH